MFATAKLHWVKYTTTKPTRTMLSSNSEYNDFLIIKKNSSKNYIIQVNGEICSLASSEKEAILQCERIEALGL